MLNPLREKKYVFKSLGVTVTALFLVFLVQATSIAGIFGMDEYQGGTLKVVFMIDEPSGDAPPRKYTMTVEPAGDGYDVTELVSSPGRVVEDVSTAFGASGGAGAAGSRYEEDDSPNIDLSPLTALDDRDVEVEPNQNYMLPEGARLVTQERSTVAGLDVVMGTYLHSNYPNQRVRMAFAGREERGLLLFPALFEREEGGEVKMRIELIEFTYEQ